MLAPTSLIINSPELPKAFQHSCSRCNVQNSATFAVFANVRYLGMMIRKDCINLGVHSFCRHLQRTMVSLHFGTDQRNRYTVARLYGNSLAICRKKSSTKLIEKKNIKNSISQSFWGAEPGRECHRQGTRVVEHLRGASEGRALLRGAAENQRHGVSVAG